MGKPFSVDILVSKLEDKAKIKVVLTPGYEIWENSVEFRAKLIELDKLNSTSQFQLLKKMSASTDYNYALQQIKPDSIDSIETITSKTFKRNIATAINDFEKLTNAK